MTVAAPGWRPPHAYIPGRTPRHPEDLFDRFKFEAGGSDIANSVAWRMGLALLDDGYFWECHEVLESVWMAAPPNSAERHLAQGVIQLANAALKQRMDQPRAAARLLVISDNLVAEAFGSRDRSVLNLARADLAMMRAKSMKHVDTIK